MSLMKMLIKRLRCLIFLRTDNSLSKSQVKLSTQLIKPNNHTHSRLQEISEISLMGVKTIFFPSRSLFFFVSKQKFQTSLSRVFFSKNANMRKKNMFPQSKTFTRFFF